MGESNFNRGQFTIAGFSYTGSSDPSDANGLDGDYYYKWDGSSMTVFGPKTSGAWGSGSALGGGVSFDGLSAQTPPLPADSLFLVQAVSAGVVVSGAGISAAQGDYSVTAPTNSRPSYANGTNTLYWNISGFSGWVLQVAGSNKYVSFDDVATPDLATTWIALEPMTVSAVTGTGITGTNGTYTPTGVLTNGKLRYIKSSSFYCYYTGTTWRFYETNWNGEDIFESTSIGDASPDLAASWVYIGSDGGTHHIPTVVAGTSVSPAPTVTLPEPETKTIEWGQLLDTDPTFAGNSDLVAPSQSAMNSYVASVFPSLSTIDIATVNYTSPIDADSFDHVLVTLSTPLPNFARYLLRATGTAVVYSLFTDASTAISLSIFSSAGYFVTLSQKVYRMDVATQEVLSTVLFSNEVPLGTPIPYALVFEIEGYYTGNGSVDSTISLVGKVTLSSGDLSFSSQFRFESNTGIYAIPLGHA